MQLLYSLASVPQLRDYLAQTQAPVVTTAHLALANPAAGGRAALPDYAGKQRTLPALASHYQNEMYFGIEAGTFAPAEERYCDYLANHDLA